LCAPFEPLSEPVETIVRESELKATHIVAVGRAPMARRDVVALELIYRALREHASAVPHRDISTGPRSMRALAALSLLRQRQRALLIFDSVLSLNVADAAAIVGIGHVEARRLMGNAERTLAKALGGPWDLRQALRAAAREMTKPSAGEAAPPVPPHIPRPVVRLLLADPPSRAPAPPVFTVADPSTIDALLAMAEAEPPDFIPAVPPKPPIPVPAHEPARRRSMLPRAAAVVVAATVMVLAALIPMGSGGAPRRIVAPPVVKAVHVAPRAVHAVAKPAVVQIKAGDTLWAIAGQRLGDPLRWTQIWRANRGRRMPGGERFTDPNLIRPGWVLRLSG
jgi:nucleoid-associated protein YgaU